MTALALRLDKSSITADAGAIATMRRMTTETGDPAPRKPPKELAIPAGGPGTEREIEVEPGYWLIEATLPSGEVLTEEVEVAEGQTIQVAFSTGDRSAREWLSWQTLAGNMPGRAALKNAFERLTVPAEAVPAGAESLRNRIGAWLEQPDFQKLRDTLAAMPIVPSARFLPPPKAGLFGEEGWKGLLQLDVEGPLHLDAEGPQIAPTDTDPETRSSIFRMLDTPGQRLLMVKWLGEAFLVSLPLPWVSTTRLDAVPAQVLVRFDPETLAVRIGVAVEDSAFAAIIGMMTTSALPKAATLARQARGLLQGKQFHPLAAAAGGYVLVASGDPGEDWAGWINNLSNWFPYIPDGAILRGAMLLRYPKDESSYDEARKSFLDGFERGLPYYSAGMTWLVDGLLAFADEDPDIERKLRLVRQVGQHLDSTQPFTVLNLKQRRP
jgi:hypothetical protein